MKKSIVNIKDLTEGVLFFDRKEPAFGKIIIIITTIIISFLVVWSYKAKKVYVVKAKGTVVDENQNYIMSTCTGEVIKNNMTEGKIVEKGDELLVIRASEYDLQQEQLELNKKIYEEKIEKYRLLISSIKDDTNYFKIDNEDDNYYYSTYEAYKMQIKQLDFDAGTYALYGYTKEQIENEIKKNEAKIAEVYHNAIWNADNSINECKSQIASIDAQLSAILDGEKQFVIKAAADGIVHIYNDVKQGMMVQTTQALGIISPANNNIYVEAIVSTADMVKIHKDDSVTVEIEGLSQNVYGNIMGKVVEIDSNCTVSSGDNSSIYFKIKIKLNENYLVSRHGDKVNVTNGMTAVSNILYDKETYMDYVLKKVGFKRK
ncbi:MAG: HlyD family secretion protein [Lachnospiraceae bacterium]|nr:HlyD family secretion protein [Lachnospiraceae bacterium]